VLDDEIVAFAETKPSQAGCQNLATERLHRIAEAIAASQPRRAILPSSCPRAANGHAAALPISMMNARRLIQ
jgi:hypothetical protein